MNTPSVDEQIDKILETYGAEAFIFGNFAFRKDVGIPLPDDDHELPPIEKAKQALSTLIQSEVVRELEALPIRQEEDEWDAVEIIDEIQQHIFTRLEKLKQPTPSPEKEK